MLFLYLPIDVTFKATHTHLFLIDHSVALLF